MILIDMPAEEYHRDPAAQPSLSSHIAAILLRESPLKAWFNHPRLNPSYEAEEDGKFDLGTCAHAVLLENDSSRIVVVEADDWRTKKAKEARAEARAQGKTPLLSKHYDDVRRMTDAALAFIEDSEIAEYWHAGLSEQTCIWQEGGVHLRCRFDRVTPDREIIMDYKSTGDAAPEPFSRLLVRMGYHWQDAFYRRGARASGATNPNFVFLAQSVEPPYECSLHACDPALREIADADIERAVRIWRDCMASGEWPSYGGRIHWAIPSAWQMKEHEERLNEEYE